LAHDTSPSGDGLVVKALLEARGARRSLDRQPGCEPINARPSPWPLDIIGAVLNVLTGAYDSRGSPACSHKRGIKAVGLTPDWVSPTMIASIGLGMRGRSAAQQGDQIELEDRDDDRHDPCSHGCGCRKSEHCLAILSHDRAHGIGSRAAQEKLSQQIA
jgi:hypothetical protein